MRAVARRLWLCSAPVLMCLALTPAHAHHPVSGFDRGKPVVVAGVVREFRWTSPHAWLYLDVPGEAASDAGAERSQPLALEGTSINVMVRNGWKSSSLRAGDHVRVVVAPRRDGTPGGQFLAVTLTGTGKVLSIDRAP